MNAEERELLHRHLNGDLDGAEQAGFIARLQESPELRRALAARAFDETLLSELVLEGRRSSRPAARRRSWVPASIAAAMLVGLTLVLTLGRSASSGLRLVSSDGDVTLHRGGAKIPLQPDLRDGDELRTNEGKAVLSGDQGRIEIEDRSAVALHSKGVTLRRGGIRAAAGSGKEIRLDAGGDEVAVKSSTVRMEISGGRVRVEAEAGKAVEVLHGGQAVRLSEGQYVSLGAAVETGSLVSRASVDAAVRKAVRFLESRRSELVAPRISEKRHGAAPRRTYAELALLALHRAGVPDSNPLKSELLGLVRGRSIDSTYAAALQAMALAEIDPITHHERIRLCAQILADSQCANGQWDYGAALALPDVPPTGRLKRRKEGPPSGDNSVSSYAILGLHACAQAGVEVETSIVDRARAWLLQCQNADGGWGYNDSGDRSLNEGDKRSNTSNASYGSATASAVASLWAIVDLRGGAFSGDSGIPRGLEWLAANFAVDRNPRKTPGFAHLHWLIAAGRAGQLLGTERFGTHEWYAEGAGYLLGTQQPGGEWRVEQGEFMVPEKNEVLDTCLAILFLRRAP